MRKIFWLITILTLVSFSLVFADVTAEIVSITPDAKGNIQVWTQYKVDNVEVVSRYPKINGKFVFCSRYYAMNFPDMSDAEIKTRIVGDVQKHSNNLIADTFIEKANEDILTNHLGAVVGTKNTEKEASIYIDMDKDGELDTEWVVKTDGTKTSKPYTPAVTP